MPKLKDGEPRRNEKDYRHVTLNMNRALWLAAKRYALDHELPLSFVVTHALRDYLAHQANGKKRSVT